MEIWEKLRKLREEKGITYEKLSNETNISISTLKAYESMNLKNRRKLSKHSLELLSDYYGVSKQYLLYEEYDNKTTENININEILGLSDKTIEVIKNVNKKEEVYESGLTFELNNNNNILMLNKFFEEFSELYDFLQGIEHLITDKQLLKLIFRITSFENIVTFWIDCYYNDKEKMNEISNYLYKCIDELIEILNKPENYFIISNVSIEEIQLHKKHINECLSKKKLSKNDKYIIGDSVKKLGELCVDIFRIIQREICFDKYTIASFINNFLDNISKVDTQKVGEYYLSDDEKLNNLIIEGKKKKQEYTEEEVKKYMWMWTDKVTFGKGGSSNV